MDDPFQTILRFLDRLELAHVSYDLKHVRDTLMVVVHVPEGYCEIESFADGTIEVEWFHRGEGVHSVAATWLDEFIAEHSE
jgi:hypothetical protein